MEEKMTPIILTASNGFIIGPIAKLFGWIMNGIFNIGITNVGVDILLLAFIVYMITLPLTIKQQKFSKMSAAMNPEIQAVQAKYKGKNDQASAAKMQAETKAIYEKYGSSPTSGCLPLIIQLPILWGLYRVIYNVPAYVSGIFNIYNEYGLISKVKQIPADQFIEFAKNMKVSIESVTDNTVVDVLWKLQEGTWEALKQLGSGISGFAESCQQTYLKVREYTMFCGINIAESPWNMLKAAFSDKAFLLCLVAIAIPVLSGVTQWLNVKLTSPAAQNNTNVDERTAQMQNSMKSMNVMMPLMSVFFCFTLPAGIGIYWVFGAVFRGIQQFIINKSLKKMDMDAEIEKNRAKYEAKRKRRGVYGNDKEIQNKAHVNTKSIQTGNESSGANTLSDKAGRKTDKVESPRTNSNPKPGSLAAKANMVRDYNERNK